MGDVVCQDEVDVSGSDLSDAVDEPVIPREKAGARRAAAAAVSKHLRRKSLANFLDKIIIVFFLFINSTLGIAEVRAKTRSLEMR